MMVGCLTDSPSRERVIMANKHNDGKAGEQGEPLWSDVIRDE